MFHSQRNGKTYIGNVCGISLSAFKFLWNTEGFRRIMRVVVGAFDREHVGKVQGGRFFLAVGQVRWKRV
jgi:hypothetical protein